MAQMISHCPTIDLEATCTVVEALIEACQWDKVELIVQLLQVWGVEHM